MSPPKKTILVIEDEPHIVLGLRDSLEFEGFRVVSTGKGRDGVNLARSESPDAIILILSVVVMGVGAAILTPASLSIITDAFEPEQRGTAILPEPYRPRIFNTKTPHSFPTFLVEGAVAGTWRYEDGRVEVSAFEELPARQRRAVDDEAERLAAWHGEDGA